MRRFLINISVFLGSVLICLVLAEISLRILSSRTSGYASPSPEGLFWRHDSLLGWALRPSATGTHTRPEFKTQIRTNRLGLRDDELPQQKPSHEFRILLLGDSVVAGFEVEREETLEAVLEKKLNAGNTGRHFAVINGGCGGYGTDQELLFLQSVGFELQPDLVILAFVPANDLENNVTMHTQGRLFSKPFFTYSGDSVLTLQGSPVPEHFEDAQVYSPVLDRRSQLSGAATENLPAPGFIKTFISRHFRLYSFFARRLKSGPPGLVSFLSRWGLIHLNAPEAWVSFYRYPPDPAWSARWQVTLDLIEMMQRRCAEKAIPFMVWMFPLKEQVYERDRNIFISTYGLNPEHFRFDLPDQILSRFCLQHDIPFYSPVPEMQRRAKAGQRFHYFSDNHFNAAGQREIADRLLSFLQKEKLIPSEKNAG